MLAVCGCDFLFPFTLSLHAQSLSFACLSHGYCDHFLPVCRVVHLLFASPFADSRSGGNLPRTCAPFLPSFLPCLHYSFRSHHLLPLFLSLSLSPDGVYVCLLLCHRLSPSVCLSLADSLDGTRGARVDAVPSRAGNREAGERRTETVGATRVPFIPRTH